MKSFLGWTLLRMVASLTVFIVSACATTRSYENAVQQWKGRPVRELTKRWGPPNKISTLADGGRIYSYIKNSDPHLVRDPSSNKTVVQPNCLTTFLVDQTDLVIGWKYEGPDCRAN